MKIFFNEKLGNINNPYLIRWVIEFKLFSIRIHHWLRSDDIRAPHDHEWNFISILFWGSISDRIPIFNKKIMLDYNSDFSEYKRKIFLPKFYKACYCHSVIVHKPAWTFLITGKKFRKWGFWIPRKGGKLKGIPRMRKRNKYFYEFGHH